MDTSRVIRHFLTRTHSIEILPDSADITVAGPEVSANMGHHIDNILTLDITHKAVNDLSMIHLG